MVDIIGASSRSRPCCTDWANCAADWAPLSTSFSESLLLNFFHRKNAIAATTSTATPMITGFGTVEMNS
ncbi:hypothetical protein MT325_m205R [Paramecium bursaria chlorella virus MT325]|uniref:Uncharacterized protein m205R n=1 Tax=Paramecium bursaria Chlorella virus MT325 TaxID=346932 RepID=A7ITT5_PBCVM|nr:hypothetical protein MT325_m205R [Paramecium bursaria chlorella virus MT325]